MKVSINNLHVYQYIENVVFSRFNPIGLVKRKGHCATHSVLQGVFVICREYKQHRSGSTTSECPSVARSCEWFDVLVVPCAGTRAYHPDEAKLGTNVMKNTRLLRVNVHGQRICDHCSVYSVGQ